MIPYPHQIPGRTQGVDVSSVQPRLPWDVLRAGGASFAIVKASESGFSDHRFSTHIADASAAGLATGAYGFLHSSEPWQPQADEYLRATDGLGLPIRPVLDWEDQRRILAATPRVALAAACAWLAYVRQHTGRRPIVYTGPGVIALFHGIDLSELAAYDLWVAHYRIDPATGYDYGLQAPTVPQPWTEARMWQWCGNRGPRFDGVPVDLDRSVFFGSQTDFDRWCDDAAPTTEPAPAPAPDGASLHALALDHVRDVEDEADALADTQPDSPTAKSSQSMRAVDAPIVDPKARS